MGLSHTVSEINRNFSRKSQFSSPLCILRPAEGVPMEFISGAWGQKIRMMGLPGPERSLTKTSAVWIQYTNVTDSHTDGRTDGRTETGRQQRPRCAITRSALTRSVARY